MLSVMSFMMMVGRGWVMGPSLGQECLAAVTRVARGLQHGLHGHTIADIKLSLRCKYACNINECANGSRMCLCA